MSASASFLRKLLFVFISVPVFIAVCALCVMNAASVNVSWWPVAAPLDMPLFVVILAAFAAGFLAGGALTRLDKQ